MILIQSSLLIVLGSPNDILDAVLPLLLILLKILSGPPLEVDDDAPNILTSHNLTVLSDLPPRVAMANPSGEKQTNVGRSPLVALMEIDPSNVNARKVRIIFQIQQQVLVRCVHPKPTVHIKQVL